MDFGFLSILPPIIAIVLALMLTKEVISSPAHRHTGRHSDL